MLLAALLLNASLNCTTCPEGLAWVEECTCLPCGEGLGCNADGRTWPCPPGTWSSAANASCTPCSLCTANGSVTARPCAAGRDTVCRECTLGFVPDANGTCVVEEARRDHARYAVMIFLVLVLEVLVCASWWRWWIAHRHYKSVAADEARAPLRP